MKIVLSQSICILLSVCMCAFFKVSIVMDAVIGVM